MTKAEFIRRELSKLGGVDFSNPKQAKLLCPYHNDTRPSLDVLLEKKIKKSGSKVITIGVGTFNCFSCSEHGPWNKLAKTLNLDTWNEADKNLYADQPDNSFETLSQELNLQEISHEYVKPVTDGPWQGAWRGLSGSFMRSIGAESIWDKEFGEYRIYLPISDAFGKLVGHVLARGENSKIPDKKKYLNSKGFNGRNYWYGLNFEENPRVLVIVEGPYDMLRLRSAGIPAIANLGIQLRKDLDTTVPDEKIMQILTKGCTKIILALDGDEAGRAATPGFIASFSKWNFRIYDLNLSRYAKSPEDKIDPGNCPTEALDDLNNFVKTLRNE